MKIRVDIFMNAETVTRLKAEAARRNADPAYQSRWTWRQVAEVELQIALNTWSAAQERKESEAAA